MEKFKKGILILIVIALIVAIVAVTVNFVLSKTDNKKNPVVTMEIEGYGTIKIELYPDMAPNTVKNFIKLTQRGYYDGKTITDIEDGLIRAGLTETTDEDGNTTAEGPKLSNIKDIAEEDDEAYTIPGEFIQNGYDANTLSHQRGVISMYRLTAADYENEIAMMEKLGDMYASYAESLVEDMNNSQSGEFFILTEDYPELDGNFTAFGKVIEGMDVVDAIAATELQTAENTDENGTVTSMPATIVISKATVETYGIDYGEPKTETYFNFDEIFNMFLQSYMQSNSTSIEY